MAKKKESKLGLVLAIGGIITAGYFWVKHQLQFLQFGSASVPFQQLKGGVVNLGISLPIINASSLGISMNRFAGYIKTPQGAILGTVALQKPVTIAKGSEGAAEFMAHITLASLASELFNIITSGNINQVNWKGYTIEGQAWVFGIPVPVKTSIV